MTTQLTLRFTVANFDAWKPHFDKHEGMSSPTSYFGRSA